MQVIQVEEQLQVVPVQEQLQNRSLTLVERATAIAITNQETYDAAAGLGRTLAALEKEITDHHQPIITDAHQTHKTALAMRDKVRDPVLQAKQILADKIFTWDREQRRLREAEEQRLAAEEKKRRDEAALAIAEQVQEQEIEAGAWPEDAAKQADVVLVEEISRPLSRPIAPPTYKKAAGVSTRETMKPDVYDLKQLCAAIGEGKVPVNLVMANMPVLNGMAKSQMTIPGVRWVPKGSTSFRA